MSLRKRIRELELKTSAIVSFCESTVNHNKEVTLTIEKIINIVEQLILERSTHEKDNL